MSPSCIKIARPSCLPAMRDITRRYIKILGNKLNTKIREKIITYA